MKRNKRKAKVVCLICGNPCSRKYCSEKCRKEAWRSYYKKYMAKHKEKKREYDKKWYEANKEKKRKKSREYQRIKRRLKMKHGEIYEVNHIRKGRFVIRIIKADDTWVRGVIVEGIAGAILDYNIKCDGEVINLRRSFASFKKVEVE